MHTTHTENMSTKLTPSTTYRAIVGKILAMHRESRGLQQTEFAETLGLSQSAWSRIETGTVSVSVEQLKLATQRLGTTPDNVLREAEQAVTQLSRRGMRVLLEQETDPALAFVGAAALGALIVAILSKK